LCPAGRFSAAGDASCTPCSAGYACPAGSVSATPSAAICVAGRYSLFGATSCRSVSSPSCCRCAVCPTILLMCAIYMFRCCVAVQHV
jgi:hypothetical protein